MCRTSGRRCPGCSSQQGRVDHNVRRRHNRAVRGAVADWARAAGEPDAVVDALAVGPPSQAKRWAEGRGLDPRLLQHRPPPSSPSDGGALRDVPERWWSAELIGQVAAAVGRQGNRAEERQLLEQPVVDYVRAGGSTNETWLVELGDGGRAYAKLFRGTNDRLAGDYGHSSRQQPVHEVAAWRLAAFLGPPWERLVAPCVLRTVDGQLAAVSAERPGYPGRPVEDAEQVTAAAVFDALIGQQDRHPGNYLVDDTYGLTLIDHGFAFSRPGDLFNWAVFQHDRVGAALPEEARDALRRLLADPSTGGLQGILEPDRLVELRRRAEVMLETGVIPQDDLDPDGHGYTFDSNSTWRSSSVS